MKNTRLLALSAALFAFSTLFSQTDFQVHFRNESVIFPENLIDFVEKPTISPAELVDGRFFRYVQFHEIPTADARKRMENEGLTFIEYVSFGCWLTAFPANFDVKKMTAWNVRSVVPMDLKWKIAPNLAERPLGKWAVKNDDVWVVAQVFPTISIDRAAQLFQEKRVKITQKGNQNGIINLEIAIADIEKIAALPFVKWLEIQPKPGSPEDTHGRSLHRSNLLNGDSPTSKKYDGAGVAVLTRDDGTVGPHIDFQGRLQNLTSTGGQFNSHGDGVSGIMAGAGNLDPTEKGMASGAKLYVVDYVADFQDTTLALHSLLGVKVTNTSYSDGCNDGYTSHSQTVDQQLFQNPTLMHSFSAGNSNFVNCNYGAGTMWGNITGGHKQSKNSIASANLYADFQLENSSSRGPATDGRIKPDISAHGQNEGSTDEGNLYQVFGGTSAASPGTAGVFAQLFGAYKTIFGSEPQAALIKAALLNTANDLGNPGPDFKYGWGHLNAYRALNLLENQQFLIGNIENGESKSHFINVPSGVRLAKIMVYWPDPEAAENAAKALVNDLDLTVKESSAGVSFLPYFLDPTPSVVLLDQPATHGFDHLNNMEQVAFGSPAAGVYEVKINGFEVPQGPATYFLVYEFLTDDVKITYPSGGEGLKPGEEEIVHWDAAGNTGAFQLDFSSDGGAAWQSVGTFGGEVRFTKWTVPNFNSGQCRLRLTRNNFINETANFSIAGIADTIISSKICPDELTISWPKIAGAAGYDVFKLGPFYMDSIGTTTDTTFTFSIPNPTVKNWVSVRAVGPNGLRGRRRVAVEVGGDLLNCPQNFDLRLAAVNNPISENLIDCNAFQQPISIKIKNDGLNAASNFPIKYQFGNAAIVSENFNGTIESGATADFEFAQKLSLTTSANLPLKIWTDLPTETARFNDTILLNLKIVINQGVGTNVKEDFEGPFPPPFFAFENPDGKTTWALAENVIGSDDIGTRCVFINFYDYADSLQEDYFYTPPFDLTTTATPQLLFDLAYAPYNDPAYNDCLKIEAMGDCGMAAPITIFEKCYEDLATTAATTSKFAPSSAADWQKKLIDLTPFIGQKVVFKFTAANGYGNNLYIDNIGIINEIVTAPLADFTTAMDTICRGDTLVFTNQSTGGLLNFQWSFGSGAQPPTASTAGPHKVKYPTVGSKTVKLTVANSLGENSASKNIFVRPLPTANFTATVNQNTVSFANTTTNALTYLWDFGDGSTSTDPSPIHDFVAIGSYTVTLTATNDCGTNVRSKIIVITTVGTADLETASDCRILPNPNGGEFLLSFSRPLADDALLVQVFDARGILLREMQRSVNQAVTSYWFSEKDLPAGFYQVVVQAGNWRRNLKMIVH